MKRIMLVGESRAGKSSLIKKLSEACPELAGDGVYVPGRAMAIEYYGMFVNTPGEFLENRWFYRALITTAAECHTIFMIQDSTRKTCLFPPGLATAFNRNIIGIISKTDADNANVARAGKFLALAGANRQISVSAVTGAGIAEVLAQLKDSSFF